mgnify:CR=1 FL=1
MLCSKLVMFHILEYFWRFCKKQLEAALNWTEGCNRIVAFIYGNKPTYVFVPCVTSVGEFPHNNGDEWTCLPTDPVITFASCWQTNQILWMKVRAQFEGRGSGMLPLPAVQVLPGRR